MKPRTPHTVIFLRFLLLTSPFAVPTACVLLPWIGAFLLGFLGTLSVLWFVGRGFVNWYTYITDPDGYHTIKSVGGDPFHDSLGIPLNFDSEDVRCQGTVKDHVSSNPNA